MNRAALKTLKVLLGHRGPLTDESIVDLITSMRAELGRKAHENERLCAELSRERRIREALSKGRTEAAVATERKVNREAGRYRVVRHWRGANPLESMLLLEGENDVPLGPNVYVVTLEPK